MADSAQVGTKVNANYDKTLDDMYALLGQEVETRTSVTQVASTLMTTTSAIQRLRTLSERVGGMIVRYEHNPNGGRSAFWRFTHDPAWIKQEAKQKWGLTPLNNSQIDTKMPKNPSWTGKRPSKKKKRVVAQEKIPETQIAQGLRKVRKSDEEATIEAARQYMNREAFIEDELRRFSEMGIEIDRTAIKFEKDPVLEAVSTLVVYIDRLKAANVRQAERLGQTHDSRGLQEQVDHMKAELAEASRKLTGVRAASEAQSNTYRTQLQAKDRRVKELEDLLRSEATKRLAASTVPEPIRPRA